MDIREQLPEDTKQFESIDNDFKELMKASQLTPLLVDCCGVENRDDLFKGLLSQLEKCQKSLNDYLYAKKNVFPRFYFVAETALLDMLSNGNDPPKIMNYFTDCFTSLKCLEFEDLSISNRSTSRNTKMADKVFSAVAMVANDGERVAFPRIFQVSGPVEIWMNSFTQVMRDSLKNVLSTVFNGETDLGTSVKEGWVLEFPAQIAILAQQIIWTEDVESSLEEFEGGIEDAVKRRLQTFNTRLEGLIK